MDRKQLERDIVAKGRELFAGISGESPSIFNKGWWMGKMMDWSMKNEDFKVRLFRFVDVLPYLGSSRALARHIEEYFSADDGDLPAVMKLGLKGAGAAGFLGEKIMALGIRSNIEAMGRQFIIGQTAKEALKALGKLRKDGFGFVVDLLGEATVSETEAEERLREHLELLDSLGQAQEKWPAHGGDGLDWGYSPRVHLSVKPSAFYSRIKPGDFEGSVQGVHDRLIQVFRRVKALGGFMCIDMEQKDYKDITIEVFKRLRSAPDLRDYPRLGIVLQAYLTQTDRDLDDLLSWARRENLPLSIRLVKGAYWDYETIRARQNGWEAPVYVVKSDSDAAFERLAEKILENTDICRLDCASHNIRTIAAVAETARTLGVPPDRYEFQVLYGMAEPVRQALRKATGRVRLYCPYGRLIPGMAYLVRRLLENTANESFLRQSFVDEADIARLLENPAEKSARDRLERKKAAAGNVAPAEVFVNEPTVDFTVPGVRAAFPQAISRLRSDLGRETPLYIGGKEVFTPDLIPSLNPADQGEVIGRVCQAGIEEVDRALAAAKKVQKSWKETPPRERAGYLLKAAEAARRRIFELSALQVLEVGKQWDQAHGDVCEAIDFLEYYAREMIRLGVPRRMGRAPGEVNHYLYRPKGLAAVISPWNFPLAISCGMISAALVAGNPVLYKPSSLSAVTGFRLVELFREAGLPEGVFNFIPGKSSVMGDYLIGHPDVGLIAFTGSLDVGLHILHQAAVPAPGQRRLKKVIAEMGGKNALIIDDDAELDEAVTQVLYSAFGFQGQKCSACSRVIVLADIYDRFVNRLVDAAASLKIGPAEDPANYLGPVVDQAARLKIMEYIESASRERRVLLKSGPSGDDRSCYVPLTIAGGVTPEDRLAQEEIFGPVLAVMKARDFEQALAWANSTKYALTGGVFSRSPKRLEQARRDFEVGNLYLNRGITGALVERHPFGGFNLSGIGSKTGGPDYLIQFMDPVTVVENTMRRGFAPVVAGDDWV
ncbi:MAG: proline dehydrogenase family protein [Pseudomonadota bacterium]